MSAHFYRSAQTLVGRLGMSWLLQNGACDAKFFDLGQWTTKVSTALFQVMGTVVSFHHRSGPWLPSESAALVAIQRELDRHGLMTDYSQGNDDDNKPWRAFYNRMTGQVVAIVTRSKAGYELLWTDRTSTYAEKLDQLVLLARSGLDRCT
jgi:hypothetical protein